MMKLRYGIIVIVIFLGLLLCETVNADGDEYAFNYDSGTESNYSSAELFSGAELMEKQSKTKNVVFSVSKLKSEKVCLFLVANTEGDETEWTEYAGTSEGVYERLFIVRDRIFNEDLSLKEREVLNAELAQLYDDTYRPDSGTVDLYDNDYSFLLKRLTCTVEEGGEKTAEKECPLSKRTAVFFAGEGETRRIRITLSCPDDLRPDEKELLQSVRWSLEAEEYNSAPDFRADIKLANKPENGEFFVPGETAVVAVTYQNAGDIDLMHVIVRLTRENSDQERTEKDHDVLKYMSNSKTRTSRAPSTGGLRYEYRISAGDVREGSVRMFVEADASCVSPEFPERIFVEKELKIPVGAEKTSPDKGDAGETYFDIRDTEIAEETGEKADETGTKTVLPDEQRTIVEENKRVIRLVVLILIVFVAVGTGLLVVRVIRRRAMK